MTEFIDTDVITCFEDSTVFVEYNGHPTISAAILVSRDLWMKLNVMDVH